MGTTGVHRADGRRGVNSVEITTARHSPAIATGDQIREARKLVQWGSASLAKRAGVSLKAMVDSQLGDSLTPSDAAALRCALRAAQRVLESAGVEFIPDEDGRARVKLRRVGLGWTGQP